MTYRIAALLIVSALLPAFAHAQIISNVSASSDSGGNAAGPGTTVRTGSSYSSVQVTTVSWQGSSTVHIKTEVNGQKHEETYTKPSGSIGVSVVASTTGYKTQVWEPAASSATATASSVPPAPLRFIDRVSNWFSRFFGFFWGR